MGILTWIIVGLVAGILAKWLMPGRDGGGIIITILLGIAGAFVGGWVGRFFGIGASSLIGTILVATGGAILLLLIYRAIKK